MDTTQANRISVTRRTARWDDSPVTVADAMDFWAFAAGAANVVMLEWLFVVVAFANRFLPVFIRRGASYLLPADVRRRVRTGRPLI